jgi:glycosyltransferase involved in cell wall biosynthesis
MRNKSKKLIYTYLERRSFVTKDLAMLEKHFRLVPYSFSYKNKVGLPLRGLHQFFFLLYHIWRADVLITFFSGYHSLLPCIFARLLNKRSIIILGGTDCFKYPSFRYGNFTRQVYGWATCSSARMAKQLLPVSANLIKSTSEYYTQDSIEQGIYVWCKGIKTPYEVVSLEYDEDVFYPQPVSRTENSFLCVSFGLGGTSFIRKGMDKVMLIAREYPEHRFTILGCERKELPGEVPENVSTIPAVPYGELPYHYSRHQFYLQLSIAEGFPSAICEAMLCECIPIGSEVAAIPEIMGSSGYLVNKRDDQVILNTIKKALQDGNKNEMGHRARLQIISRYGKGSRERNLLNVINNQIQG